MCGVCVCVCETKTQTRREGIYDCMLRASMCLCVCTKMDELMYVWNHMYMCVLMTGLVRVRSEHVHVLSGKRKTKKTYTRGLFGLCSLVGFFQCLYAYMYVCIQYM